MKYDQVALTPAIRLVGWPKRVIIFFFLLSSFCVEESKQGPADEIQPEILAKTTGETKGHLSPGRLMLAWKALSASWGSEDALYLNFFTRMVMFASLFAVT